jgi:hypothetical protein
LCLQESNHCLTGSEANVHWQRDLPE